MANKRLNAIIQIGGAVSSSLGSAFGSIGRETDKLGSSIQRLKDRQRELNNEIAKVGRDGSNAASLRVQYAQQEAAAIGKQVAALRQRQALEKAQEANAGRRAELRGKIGGTMAASAAVFAPIGAAIKTASDFDYDMQLIGNTAEMTAAQIGKLKKSVLDTSKATGQSATNIQKGMGFLVAAGMDPEQSTKYLSAIGKTATASASDVEDLSKMVFTLSDSLKIGPDGMQAAIDSLAQTDKNGSVKMAEIAKVLPVLGSGFAALNMQGREAAATMGAALQIARKGTDTADKAAGNMENFISKIMSPETRKKALKNFNLDIEKVIRQAQQAGANPFEAAMQAVITATKGDQARIGDLFQDMEVQKFIRPMIQNWDEYKKIKDKALGADGVIERDFITMMQTTKQQIMEVANATGRLGVALGSVFSSDAGKKSATMAERIGQLTDFINANKELVRTTAKVVGGLFAARLAVLGVQYVWATGTGIFLGAQKAWMGLVRIAPYLSAGLGMVARTLLFVGRALLMNPIGLVVSLIAGAAFLIWKNWDTLGPKFEKLWDGIKSIIGEAYDWIVGKVKSLLELPGKVVEATKKIFSGGGDPAAMQYDAMGNATGTSLPDVPAPAARGGSSVVDSSTNTYHITQQPGQDTKALADEIERRRRAQAGVRARSSMLDGVGAQ